MRKLGILMMVGWRCAALAAPIVQRVEVDGVPQVLQVLSGMYDGNARSTENMGYHFDHDRIYWHDGVNGGYSYAWLDPAIGGDLAGAHDSKTGVGRHWNSSQNQYAGTVSGGVRYGANGSGKGFAYLSDARTMLHRNSLSGGQLNEIQAARSVAGVDEVTEGTAGDQVLTVRLRSISLSRRRGKTASRSAIWGRMTMTTIFSP